MREQVSLTGSGTGSRNLSPDASTLMEISSGHDLSFDVIGESLN
jgi:hypothetical protein